MLAPAPADLFVVPSWRGLPTGGNVYNEGLLAALSARGWSYRRCEPERLGACADGEGAKRWVWVDSLYFEQLPALRASLPPGSRLGLLAHALPSTLAQAEGREPALLIARERRELERVDCALSTSGTMRAELRLRAPGLCTCLVEPAIRRATTYSRLPGIKLRALIVANLTPNKGVLPWLRALARRMRAEDDFELRCVGRCDADPEYARACLEIVRETPLLRARVVLTGMQSEPAVRAEIARAHVLVSASRYESFGMAIADARASGCVVIARAGGHVRQLVDARAGGALLADDDALADAFLSLVRNPSQLRERLASAAERPLATRSWDDAARDFLAHARAHGPPSNAQ